MFSHSMMVLQAAALGQGIALGNTILARPEIDAGRLVIPFAEKIQSKDSFYLVCEENQAELGKIAAFREWIMAEVEAENAAIV
jgi:LysR family glycine cleavage system transcriptional activator